MIAIAQFECQVNNVFPDGPFLQFTELYSFVFPNVEAKDPLKDAVFICTDGSYNGEVACGEHGVQKGLASTQIVDL